MPNEAAELAAEFYRLWDPTSGTPGPRDREQAAVLLELHGIDEVRALLPLLVQVTRQRWPECRSFSGVSRSISPTHSSCSRASAGARQPAIQPGPNNRPNTFARSHNRETEQQLVDQWNALSTAEKDAIRQTVLARLPGEIVPEAFVRRLCLEALRTNKIDCWHFRAESVSDG